MDPKNSQPQAEPSQQAPQPQAAGQFQIIGNKEYVLVVTGEVAVLVRDALDAVGRNLGADAGSLPWSVRQQITNQLGQESETEAYAAGLISGREAQRAAAKTQAIKEDSAQAVASKTAARKKK